MDARIHDLPFDRVALDAASEPLGVDPDQVGDAIVLDVRRAAVYEQALTTLPGARWFDPEAVQSWLAAVPAGRDVVVYCVHGHEVSRATAMRLCAAGVNARFLRGGIEAWQAAGRPLVGKPSTA